MVAEHLEELLALKDNGGKLWYEAAVCGGIPIVPKHIFDKGDFKDNISFLLKWGSLGSKHYDRKVFNNIWGTFTFGPNNSFYIGAYRGFIRVSSN